MDKVKSAENFLRSLEDSDVTRATMVDRMDSDIVSVINNYSRLLSKVKDKAGVDTTDLVTCSLIIGYLLNSHVQRYEMEKVFRK